MIKATKSKMHQYYKDKNILPTYARLTSVSDLDKHEERRASFFRDKLYLPPRIFHNSEMVEFGPDSGENALVFSRWGAYVALAEPNPNARSYIIEYFKRFGLTDRLRSLEEVDLAGFAPAKKFDFIDAEGFIYTVRPDSVWIKLFDRILKRDGFFIISYLEFYGCLLELILRLIYARARDLLGLDPKETALKLFKAKWNSIPHIRSFDSWHMDVLENPYLRLKYFYTAGNLCKRLAENRFCLYSSWPCYMDALNVYWHKKELFRKERVRANIQFAERSCLSFAFGKKLFLTSMSEEPIKKASAALFMLLQAVDKSIAEFNVDYIRGCSSYLEEIKTLIMSKHVLADSSSDKNDVIKLIVVLAEIFNILVKSDAKNLVKICNSSEAFINFWGQPNHFAVFRKENE